MPPFIFIAIAFISSCFLSSLSPVLPHYSILALLSSFLILCFFYRQYIIASAIVGLLLGFLQAYQLISQQLPDNLDGKKLLLVGTVQGLPQNTATHVRFLLKIESITDEDGSQYDSFIHRQVQLTRYFSRGYVSKTQGDTHTDFRVKPSQQWALWVKMKRPRGFVNPSGFDYALYLLRKEINATGYVLKNPPVLLLDGYHSWSIDCFRRTIKQAVKNYVPDASSTTVGPLLALLVGDSQHLTAAQWDVFRNTGTIHLLAISGLHIGLAATIGAGMGRFIVSLSSVFLPFTRYLRYCSPFLSISFALLYSLLAGMSLPTQRALIMVVLFHLSRIFYYRLHPMYLVLGALCIIAAIDPLAVYNQGFWLSFLAVICLIYGFTGRNVGATIVVNSGHSSPNLLRSLQQYLTPIVYSQWILAIALLIPSLLWLQGVSLSAPIVNIVAIAWVSLIVVPLLFVFLFFFFVCSALGSFFSLLSLPWLMEQGLVFSDVLLRGSAYLVDGSVAILLSILIFFDERMPSFWYSTLGTPSRVAAILFALGCLWLLLPKGLPYRFLGVFCLSPVFFSPTDRAPLRVTFMDAGQGTAVVVETKNHSLIYDTGKAYSERFNVGEHVIAPYVRDNRLSPVDRLVVSHKDGDHAGGVEGLLSSVVVNEVYSGQWLENIENQQLCHAGQEWQWDDVHFSVLWPQLRGMDAFDGNNNQSCVLLIRVGGQQILLVGDIEKKVEEHLLRNNLLPQRVSLLLVPHHGSKTSSSLPFIRHVKPRWAVVTAGYQNAYRHPHPVIVDRYERMGIEVMNTAELGALRWTLKEDYREILNVISDKGDKNRTEAHEGNVVVETGRGGDTEVSKPLSFAERSQLYSSQDVNIHSDTVWQVERWRVDYRRYWYD